MSGKLELHQSDLLLCLMCGEAFRRRVLENERRPVSYLANRGTAVHKGRQHNLSQKIESKVDCPVDEVLGATRDKAVELVRDECVDMREFPGIPKTAVMSQLIDESTALAEKDHEIFHPDIQPVAVELNVSIEIEEYDFNLGGTIDTVHFSDVYRVIDFKTKKRTPSQSEADGSDQLSLYAMFAEAEFGVDVNVGQMECLVVLKSQIKPVRLITEITPDDKIVTLRKFAAVNNAIQTGNFLPAAPNHWKCSRAYCEYYDDCRFVNCKRGAMITT